MTLSFRIVNADLSSTDEKLISRQLPLLLKNRSILPLQDLDSPMVSRY